MIVYFFSGLGADERVFQKITIPNQWRRVYIKWESPRSSETLQEYSKKIADQIIANEDFSFIGLSFGGVVAIEVSKIVTPKHLIIVSSVSNNRELSFYYRVMGFFKVYKIIPGKLFTLPSFITYWFFGVRSKEEKKFLRNVLKDLQPSFARWAIGRILTWKQKNRPPGILHIHGKSDRLFRIKKVNADIEIKGGGHLMIYNKAEEISPYLESEINKKTSSN